MNLHDLKKGDPVRVFRSWSAPTIEVVDRTTPTTVIVDGMPFRKRDGYAVGWSNMRIERIEPEEDNSPADGRKE